MSKSIGSLLKKKMEKSGISVGFKEVKTWIDTGSYVLNNIVSGSFFKGIPLGKSILIAGEPGAGKSLIAASIAKHAQDQGVFPVFLDTEHALDEPFLQGIGVNTDDDAMQKYDITTIDEAKKAITETIHFFEDEFPEDDRPEVLFILDSLGMMLTEKESKESNKGELKGDQGQRAKQLKHFYRGITSQIGAFGAGLVSTNHIWTGSDKYGNPIKAINGGQGQIYAASIVLMVGKKELKEGEGKDTETKGVYIAVKCEKTRFSQPFRKVTLTVPYETGIDPYSGLLEAFEVAGLVTKKGAWYTNVSTGKKFQSKNAKPILDEILQANQDITLHIEDEDSDEVDKPQVLMEQED